MESGNKFVRLSKDSLIYGVGGALGTFIGVFLTPILTRLFTPADYGVLELVASISTILTIVLTLGFDTALSIEFFSLQDERARKRLLATSTLLLFIISAVGVAVISGFAGPLDRLLLHSGGHEVLLIVSFVTIPLTLVLSNLLLALRLHFRPWAYAFLSFGRAVLVIGLTLVFVLGYQQGLVGYFWAALCAQVLMAGVSFVIAVRYLGSYLDWRLMRPLIKIGLPLIPAGIAAWSLNLIDRFFLTGYATLQEVGYYSLGVRLASVLMLVVAAFRLAWGPFALSIAKQDDAKNFYARILTYYALGMIFLAVGLSVFAKEILLLFTTPEYLDAAFVVAPLAMSAIAYGAYYIVAIGVNITKQTQHIAWTTGAAALLNIGLNFLLIPPYGMIGAAIATVASYVISVYLLYLVSQKYYPIEFQGRKIFAMAVLASLTIYAGMSFNQHELQIAIPSKVVLLLVYTALAWKIFLSFPERHMIVAFVRGLRRRPTSPTESGSHK